MQHQRRLALWAAWALCALCISATAEEKTHDFSGFPPIGKFRKGERTVKVITSDAVTGLLRPKWTRAMGELGGWPVMYRFKDAIYLAYPHVDGHRYKKHEATGKLLCYASKDEGKTWTAHNPPPGSMSSEIVVANGKIYAYDCPQDSQVSVSADGVTWSEPKPVYKPKYCIWGVMYDPASKAFWAPPHHIPTTASHPDRKVDLITSKDGVNWEKVSTVASYNNCSEAAIAFEPDRTMVVLLRRKYGRNFTMAVAKPPYKEWTHTDQPGILEGEHFFTIGGQTFLTARANYVGDNADVKSNPKIFDGRRSYSMIYRYQDRKLVPWAVMDSMGDCSYPFLVETPTEILCAYYSQHEDKVCKCYLCGYDKKEFLGIK